MRMPDSMLAAGFERTQMTPARIGRDGPRRSRVSDVAPPEGLRP